MESTLVRVWKGTHRLLRIVSAYTDETMIELIDRLIREEADRQGIPTEKGEEQP